MADAKTYVAGAEISLRIGQRVSHGEFKGRRVTGIVRGLNISDERGITAIVLLDEPIVIPPHVEGDREIRITWQTIEAHELTPFDARDELIGDLLGALISLRDAPGPSVAGFKGWSPVYKQAIAKAHAAIAKATGGVA